MRLTTFLIVCALSFSVSTFANGKSHHEHKKTHVTKPHSAPAHRSPSKTALASMKPACPSPAYARVMEQFGSPHRSDCDDPQPVMHGIGVIDTGSNTFGGKPLPQSMP